jgi:hypothetical protein
VIALDERSKIAEAAKRERSKLAEVSFRAKVPIGVRPDGVMYCLDAIKQFSEMPQAEVQRIGFEIALLGRSGIDANDPNKRYTLKSLPGQYSGVQLLCLMFVAFKQIMPGEPHRHGSVAGAVLRRGVDLYGAGGRPARR